jgi:enterochelin esterase-like enzyme
VLFLLHGGGSDPSAWTVLGKVNVILDNLIVQRKARPMIVVMPLGFGTMDVITRGGSAWDDPELVHRNLTRFSDVLFHEVMPLVKQQYPASAKREDHSVAGLSMGGTVGSVSITSSTLAMSEASVPALWNKAAMLHPSWELPPNQRQP